MVGIITSSGRCPVVVDWTTNDRTVFVRRKSESTTTRCSCDLRISNFEPIFFWDIRGYTHLYTIFFGGVVGA
jgi:hypothetical protein